MICIYHSGCMDGFGAAWVVWKKFQDKEIEFIPARYGDEPPPLLAGKSVVIVDFSYPRDVLLQINEIASSLLVLDHHKTAQANCEGLDFARFNMNKSGAVMAWEWFYPGHHTPSFLRYIQDRDLWRFEMEHSKAINAAIFSYPMDFEVWNRTFAAEPLTVEPLSHLKSEGEAILRDRQKTIDSLTRGWAVTRLNIAGYDVPCLNCPRWLASETLNILAQDEPFAIGYFDSANERTFELRSAEDGIDVSEIAKRFGGGGHFHAAGFSGPKPPIIGGLRLPAKETN